MNLLFVHGINVRGGAWFASLDLITRKAKKFLPDYKVTGCGWGDPFGARLHRNGASVPDYNPTGNALPARAQADRALWHLLSSDPLLELRLLPEEQVIGVHPGEEILAMLPEVRSDAGVLAMLSAWGVQEFWPPFIDGIVAAPEWKAVVLQITLTPPAASEAVAKAVTAGFLQQLRSDGVPELSGEQRDQLEVALINLVGGPAEGILTDWLLSRITHVVTDRRGSVTDLSAPAVGDVIHYQARGDAIRKFIAEKAEECKADVVLAHSLGGVACVDWLASGKNPAPSVKKLVTAGSQAGYFYEVDGLVSTPYGTGLPDTFPTWLNIFDRSDLLGYFAEPIFPKYAVDFEVDSGQPFPSSHSAYWQNDVVWMKIAEFLEN